jgi:hypothetical protein
MIPSTAGNNEHIKWLEGANATCNLLAYDWLQYGSWAEQFLRLEWPA